MFNRKLAKSKSVFSALCRDCKADLKRNPSQENAEVCMASLTHPMYGDQMEAFELLQDEAPHWLRRKQQEFAKYAGKLGFSV